MFNDEFAEVCGRRGCPLELRLPLDTRRRGSIRVEGEEHAQYVALGLPCPQTRLTILQYLCYSC